MRYDIIKTEKYLLVCDDSEIKVGDWTYNPMKGIIFLSSLGLMISVNSFTKKIIAHLSLNGAPYLDGVPVIPPLPQEDDVKELFKEEYEQARKRGSQDYAEGYYGGILDGYEQAREKYKFTKEDILNAIETGYQCGLGYDDDNPNIALAQIVYIKDNFIQSLQQPKLPIAFECEIEPEYKYIGAVKGVKGSGDKIKNKNAGKPKTITNSEGRVEWVGKYIYN
jgi:hypothetical protein